MINLKEAQDNTLKAIISAIELSNELNNNNIKNKERKRYSNGFRYFNRNRADKFSKR